MNFRSLVPKIPLGEKLRIHQRIFSWILVDLYLMWFVCATAGASDRILLDIRGDFHSEGFLDGGYPKPGDIPLLNRKIFRGTRVSSREHPYVASVRRMYAHYTIGSIITRNLVISVAHPFIKVNPAELGVVVGQNYFDRGTFMATVVVIIIHENFDPYTLAGDIALLRLYEDLVFKLTVKPIAMASYKEKLNDKTAFVTGWGRCDRTGKELCLWRSSLYNRDEKMDPMLRSISFKIVLPNFYCQGYEQHDVHLKPGMMCLGPAREEDPVAPCLAVPGAPLVVDAHLAGMLSWGFGCGYSFDLPLVYTNIQHYYRWLYHNVPILRSIKSENLTAIFDATRAYVLSEWLMKTRLFKPNIKDYIFRELQSLSVDYKLSALKGDLYDIRDFINNGMYHDDKLNMYDSLKKQNHAIKSTVLKNKVETVPFIRNIEEFNNEDAVIFVKNETEDVYDTLHTTSSNESIITDIYN